MTKIVLVVGGMLLLNLACGSDGGGPSKGSGGATSTGTGGSASGSGGALGTGGVTGGTGSGGTTAAGASGVNGAKMLNELTTDEIGKLCDWGAALFGGYGKTKTCDDGTTSSSQSSRATCVSETPYKNCAATVAQLEPCLIKLYQSCLSGLFSAECSPLLPCLM